MSQATVIVPSLNAGRYIEQQLQALGRQRTDVTWELIVSDNGSTDGTIAIVERMAPELGVPVRLIDASIRPGVAAARNLAVAAARGRYLLFADADDVADEDWVQEMVSALEHHPYVGGRLEVLALNSEEVAGWRAPLVDGELPKIGGVPYAVGANLGCTAEVLAEVGGFDETLTQAEDADFGQVMHAHGITAAYAERAVIHYRYRSDPRQAVRQMWAYGRSTASLFPRWQILPPTFLDAATMSYRSFKQGLRAVLQGRLPVRAAADLAYVLGEASVLRDDREFWRLTTRRTRVMNPLTLLRRRLARSEPGVGGGH